MCLLVFAFLDLLILCSLKENLFFGETSVAKTVDMFSRICWTDTFADAAVRFF